eukprot:5537338-Amphidinium_carterae.1
MPIFVQRLQANQQKQQQQQQEYQKQQEQHQQDPPSSAMTYSQAMLHLEARGAHHRSKKQRYKLSVSVAPNLAVKASEHDKHVKTNTTTKQHRNTKRMRHTATWGKTRRNRNTPPPGATTQATGSADATWGTAGGNWKFTPSHGTQGREWSQWQL